MSDCEYCGGAMSDDLETALYEIMRAKCNSSMRATARKALSGKKPGSVARMEYCIADLTAKLEAATAEVERLKSRIQDAVDTMRDGDNMLPATLVKDMGDYLQKTLDGEASAEGDAEGPGKND